MNHALPGALLLLASGAGAAQVLDCPALANATGIEPVGYVQQCTSSPAPRPAAARAVKQAADTDILAYAVQVTSVGDAVETGLYGFLLDQFDQAERIGPAISGIHALSFNPAGNRLYAIRYDENAGSVVGELDLDDGSFNPMLALGLNPNQRPTGLSLDPRTGTGWLVSNRSLTNNPPLSEAYLWLIDITTGQITPWTRLLPDDTDPVIIDIAMSCAGELYAHNISDDSLYRITTGDGVATRVGGHGLPANFAQGMDFDRRDDSLYAWIYTGGGNNAYGAFDTATGAFTPIAENSPRGQWIGAIPGQCAPITIQDPAAFDGAWYAYYSNGQGFTVRYFEEARTWFMPWFTFTPEEEDLPDDVDLTEFLRWYSLQGEVDPGAAEVELDIVLTTHGLFDDPAPVQRVIAGSARLHFLSCFQGVLEYQFDPGYNDGLQGSIALSRLTGLTPLGRECSDANGVVREAQASYDALITGSWYDPNASGQGVELFRIPQTEDAAGRIYGAWFTYDPEPESPADPAGQHWFTVEGHVVVNEEQNIIRSTIIQTIGGSFDGQAANPPSAVGSVTFTPTACDRLTMAYDFIDSDVAGAFRDLEGEIQLHRIGACPPPPPPEDDDED